MTRATNRFMLFMSANVSGTILHVSRLDPNIG
jgi:hypothetical protein